MQTNLDTGNPHPSIAQDLIVAGQTINQSINHLSFRLQWQPAFIKSASLFCPGIETVIKSSWLLIFDVRHCGLLTQSYITLFAPSNESIYHLSLPLRTFHKSKFINQMACLRENITPWTISFKAYVPRHKSQLRLSHRVESWYQPFFGIDSPNNRM